LDDRKREPEAENTTGGALVGLSHSPAGQTPLSERIPSPKLIRRLPLVGRKEELERLKSNVEDAIRGRGSVVFLTGEAGIGKTRLAEELSRYAIQRGVRFLQGVCLGEKGEAPYYPWIELIREFVNQAPMPLFRIASFLRSSNIA